ncbi:hypothetical protein X801_09281, partial [Opisthorchis viverrini]
VHALLREHRAGLEATPSPSALSTLQRTTVYSLVKRVQVERLGDQGMDEDVPSSRSHRALKPMGFVRRATRRLGRPPVRSDKWCRDTDSRTGPGIIWPSSEHGLFCLLRGFLTQGGERRRLTTAQLCEYVREWQTQMGLRLQRAGGAWTWISRAEDWSAITPSALQFLTAEAIPNSSTGSSSGVIRHSSRRLVCPRPFVDPKPRVHQWSWLLAPPTATSAVGNAQLVMFEAEAKELADLFTEWLRAPRGLGGLADAEWLASATAVGGGGRRRRKARVELTESAVSRVNSDSGDTDDSGHLRITGDLSESDDNELVRGIKISDPKYRQGKLQRTTVILDETVPPPFCPTNWKLKPFSEEQVISFQSQEAERFARPWLPFVYRIQNYESVVGPLRSAPSAASQGATVVLHQSTHVKARDHPLLRPDRPIYVSLAEIVRDAVACLPNGEGTRGDITTLVQNSGFLLQFIDQRKLQQCVSSALDRLQGEASDPSVYFNAAHRIWVYRHRHRTPEEFAEIHETRCAMNEAKRSVQRGDVRTSSATASAAPKFRGPRMSLPHTRHPDPSPSTSKYVPSHPGRLPIHSGPGQLQRYLCNLHPETTLASQSDEDEVSDVHIPDIEELEAADRLRQVRGSYSFFPEHSSLYGHEEDEDEEIDYEFDAVQEEQLIVEPTNYIMEDSDGLYSPSFRGSLQPRRVFGPSVGYQHRFHSGYQRRHASDHNPPADDFLELHRSLRQ